MRIDKVVTSYIKLNDSALNTKANFVKLSLTDNAYFPVTTPTPEEFGVIQETFSQALVEAEGRGLVQVEAKRQARKNLIDAMRLLAMNINVLANGDRLKLASSGFDLASTGEAVNLGSPTDFRIVDGNNPGELKLSIKGVVGAMSYIYELGEALTTAETVWQSHTATTSELLIKNLPSAKRMYARVRVVGRRGQEATTEVQSRVVQ